MWRRGRAQKRDEEEGPRPVDAVSEECETFLAGRYADHLQAVGRPVPPWAWLNALAHGSDSDLRALAAEEPRWRTPAPRAAREWQQSLAFLATHLVDLMEARQQTLQFIQQQVLIPIE